MADDVIMTSRLFG